MCLADKFTFIRYDSIATYTYYLLDRSRSSDVAKVVLPWCHLKPKACLSSVLLTSPKDAEEKKKKNFQVGRSSLNAASKSSSYDDTDSCS